MERNTKTAHWRAIYSSGEALEQMNNSQEVLYENIDKEELVKFFLLDCYDFDIGVNLENGTIIIDEKEICIKNFSNKETRYRLIYYISSSEKHDSEEKIFYLGLQTTIENKNEKFLMQISKDEIVLKQR